MTAPEPPPPADPIVDEQALRRAEAYVEAEEGAASHLTGALGAVVAALAVAMSLFHLYAAYSIVPTQTLRPVHVAFVLVLSFLVFPVSRRFRHRVMWWDWLAALAAVVVVAYMLHGGDDFTDRNTSPDAWDIVLGTALIALILEACAAPRGGSCRWCRWRSSPTLSRAPGCRLPGPTRATTSAGSSATCT
jgi:TRAP-type uncharacterized transport system fused permease subunit